MSTQEHSFKRVKFGPFEIDLAAGELFKSGIRIRLQEKPLQILVRLVEHQAEIVTREELHELLWPGNHYVEFDHNLNNAINKLRDALCDSADKPAYIETIPRKGYRFIVPAVWASSENSNSVRAEVATEFVPPAVKPSGLGARRQGWAVAFSVALLLIAGAIIWWGHSYGAPPAIASQARETILVSDIENRTGDAAFGASLEDALRRQLSNTQLLDVVPHARIEETLQLMRKPLDSRIDAELGQEICVRDGGIRAQLATRAEKVSSTIVLSLQLMNPLTGQVVSSFEGHFRNAAEALAATHLVANGFSEAMVRRLPEISNRDAGLRKVTTSSLDALRLYTKADDELRSGKQSSQATALELLNQALSEDPDFASASILSAWAAYNQRKANHMDFAKRALAQSSKTSESERYFIEGSYFDMRGQMDEAIASYRALLRIDPTHFWGNRNLVGLLTRLGRIDELAELSVRRAGLEPDNFERNVDAAWSLAIVTENVQQARSYLNRANELLPAVNNRKNIAADAIWLQLFPAYEAWMRDDATAASAELARAQQKPFADNGIDDPVDFGLFAAALGQTKAATSWLHKISLPISKGLSDQPHESMPTTKQMRDENNFATLAFAIGERPVLENVFDQISWPLWPQPVLASFMLREGQLRGAEEQLRKFQGPQNIGTLERSRKVLRGEILVEQGKAAEAIPLLSEGVKEVRDSAIVLYFLGARSLARAYEQQRDFSRALQVLEESEANRPRVNYGPVMVAATFWMQNQLELSRIYRKVGRRQAAQRVEDQLRKLLACADPDFPMLIELNNLERLPVSAARRN